MNQVVPSFVAQYGIAFAGVGAQTFLCDFERSVWLCLNCKLGVAVFYNRAMLWRSQIVGAAGMCRLAALLYQVPFGGGDSQL